MLATDDAPRVIGAIQCECCATPMGASWFTWRRESLSHSAPYALKRRQLFRRISKRTPRNTPPRVRPVAAIDGRQRCSPSRGVALWGHRIHLARARTGGAERLAGRLQSSATIWLAWPPDTQRSRRTRSGSEPAQLRNSGYELTRNGGNVRIACSLTLFFWRQRRPLSDRPRQDGHHLLAAESAPSHRLVPGVEEPSFQPRVVSETRCSQHRRQESCRRR
jgi:hypothetical protein